MKKISVLIPTFNEEDNVVEIASAAKEQLTRLNSYDYDIIFIDNASTDSTREKIRQLCANDSHIRAIFNAKNYGQFNSPYYGLLQSDGDCCITMCQDFQDPPELIPQFINEWEMGNKIILGQRFSSYEKGIFRKLRKSYYKFLGKHSTTRFLPYVTGFGLYDKSFIDVLRTIDDPRPFLRGITAELGYNIKTVQFSQPKRRAGKSTNNFTSYYDAAMQSISTYTKFPIRLCTGIGFVCTLFSIGSIAFCIGYKCFNWFSYNPLQHLLLLGIMLIASMTMFFVGIIGEYVLDIRDQVRKRPLVLEQERINFDK